MSKEVFIYKVQGYKKSKIKEAARRYFDKNTPDNYFKGKKILLKPNMLQSHSPSENVTTHPVVLDALAELLTDLGGECSIGDSPSGWGKQNTLKAAKECGFLDVCDRQNIEFDVFSGQNTRKIKIPEGRVYTEVHIPESYFNYDTVVNIPKLKTHSLTVFTLGVKNMLGMIPGAGKTEFHSRAPHPKKFAAALADLYQAVRPDFTVLDGIEGMEGSGPVGGDTVKFNRLFMAKDTNALDATVEKMCGIKPKKVPLTQKVYERNCGEIHDIIVKKDYEIENPGFKNFKISPVSILGTKVPSWLVNFISPFLFFRPVCDEKDCIKCGKCKKVCPVDAIEYENGYPRFDMDKCIKCFCCAERCPQTAIRESKNLLSKFF
ncbi:MAG: DUF362 domain-containing protein [Elusimicrobiota bacterium]